MSTTYNGTVCRGDWSLGTACGKCQLCRDTEATYLREQLADAAQKAGEYAHWARGEIAMRDEQLAVASDRAEAWKAAAQRFETRAEGFRAILEQQRQQYEKALADYRG